MKYAFLNAESIVVNVISGTLSAAQQAQFLRDYGIIYGAVAVIEIDAETRVWKGGAYTDGVFNEPPAPEPQPEPLPDPQPEPEI